MESIKLLQARALERLGFFMDNLKKATNDFEIEAQTYTIMRAAESLYKQMHKENSGSIAGPEVLIDVTHIRRLDDGRVVELTEKIPLAEEARSIANIAKAWAHKHYRDEDVDDFDNDFVDSCDICKDRQELAIEEGRACAKHPLAYFEPEGSSTPVTCAKCGSMSEKGSDVCLAHGGRTDKRPAYCEACDDEKKKGAVQS